MRNRFYTQRFISAAHQAGAETRSCPDLQDAAQYVAAHAGGPCLPPLGASLERAGFGPLLQQAGGSFLKDATRASAASAAAGITGANFALAATGTVVLESTAEAVRLASTLPERHFVLLDPVKIVADDAAAIPLLRHLQEHQPRNYLAWITGPSRTADIERVLTIGVHGPKELHVLLVPGISADCLEM